jgi:hypothetical protein
MVAFDASANAIYALLSALAAGAAGGLVYEITASSEDQARTQRRTRRTGLEAKRARDSGLFRNANHGRAARGIELLVFRPCRFIRDGIAVIVGFVVAGSGSMLVGGLAAVGYVGVLAATVDMTTTGTTQTVSFNIVTLVPTSVVVGSAGRAVFRSLQQRNKIAGELSDTKTARDTAEERNRATTSNAETALAALPSSPDQLGAQADALATQAGLSGKQKDAVVTVAQGLVQPRIDALSTVLKTVSNVATPDPSAEADKTKDAAEEKPAPSTQDPAPTA